MLEVEMGRKLAVSARDAVGVATGVVSHLIWFVSYQVDGTTRAQQPLPRPKSPPR
jgi:hypothetical protein